MRCCQCAPPIHRQKRTLLDFDNDGDLDIYVSGYNSYNNVSGLDDPNGRVILNQTIVNGKGIANQAPSAPTNLVANQDSIGIHLTWDAAVDDHTPPTGISYDVILYINGKPVTGAILDPVTGVRRALVPGRHINSALLNNLTVGNYTWKVQAVDQSFIGSPLSPQGNFLFRPQPPVMNDTVIYRCGRTITLTAKGQNIEWYSDKALTNKIASGDFHPTTSQNVYVVQNVDTIKSVPRFVRISIFEKPSPPVIPGPNPVLFCEYLNGTIGLQAQGDSLTWYADQNKNSIKGTGNFIYVNTNTSSYYVTQTITGCESDVAEVDLKPVVIAKDISFKDGKIYSGETDGQYYYWFENNMFFYETTDPFISYNGDSAVYFVRIEKNNCIESSASIRLWNGKVVTGIQHEFALSVYPNPARLGSEISVSIPSSGILNLYDAKGSLICSRNFDTSGNYLLPSMNWSSGLYLVSFDDGTTKWHFKFVII